MIRPPPSATLLLRSPRFRSPSRFIYSTLRPALGWLEAAPGQSLDAGDEAVVAERPADALGGAQASELIQPPPAFQENGQLPGRLPDRRKPGQPLVPAPHLGA